MIIGMHLHTGDGNEIKVVAPVIHHMDDYFNRNNSLKNKDYGGGIDNFLVVPFVVFTDEKENSDFAKPSHKVERVKDHYGDKGWIKTIVFALPFNPELVSKMSHEEFRILLCDTILERLKDPQMKILKAFDYEDFKEDITKEIIFYRDNVSFKKL